MPLRMPPPALTNSSGLILPPQVALGLAMPAPGLAAGGIVYPIGGLQSLRGAKPFTPATAAATVAAPYGVAQINAGKAAAGAGVLRFNSGINYPGNLIHDVPGQTWELVDQSAVINGAINMTGAGTTIHGGKVTGDIEISANNCSLLHLLREGGYRGVHNGGRDNLQVINCEFYNQTGGFGGNDYNSNQGLTPVDGQLWQNCIGIMSSTNNLRTGTVGGNDNEPGGSPYGGNGARNFKNAKVTNCYFDNGLTWNVAGQDKFGLEWWGHVPGIGGRGLIVEYCELKGGNGLSSAVRSKNNWFHHNIWDLTVSFSAMEVGGSGADTRDGHECSGWVIEDNIVFGTGGTNGTPRGWFVYQNNGARYLTIRRNKATGISDFVTAGDPNAGGYVVEDNCLVNVTNVIGGGYGIGNVVNRNGPGFGPCAP